MRTSRHLFFAVATLIAGCSSTSNDQGVSAPSALDPSAEKDGLDAVKTWAQTRTSGAASVFRQAGSERYSPRRSWAGEIVYSMQVDRFNDGDPTNNGENLPGVQTQFQGGPDLYGVPEYRHGGDLRGITERLDYIKDLGATALWVTPIFKHDGSYHGYCTADFSEIDPGFGTKEDLRTLVSEAHARGIRVVLDIVVNHMCDNHTTYSKAPDHDRCPRDLDAKNWSGASGGSSAQGELAFGDTFFSPLRNQYFFNRCGANSHDEMAGTESPAVYGDFVATMLDFDTRNYDFQEIFTELHKYWIAYADIDGFRVDAAKHVTEDFLAYFSTQIRKYAASIGKPDFYLVGEVAGPADWMARRFGGMMSNPRNPDDHGNVPATLTSRLRTITSDYLGNASAPYPGLDGLYDFPHSGTARDVLLNGAPTRRVEDFFSGEAYRTVAAQGDARQNWTVLEIHDWPRFASTRKDDPYKSSLGLSYLATAQGVPVIYYGMEQGFNGDCHADSIDVGGAKDTVLSTCSGGGHERYRQDMFVTGAWRLGSTVTKISQLAHIGRPSEPRPNSWETDPYLDRTHAVYQTAKRMMRIRQSCAPLSYGSTSFRWGEVTNEGLFAFSRIDAGREMLVVVNTSPVDRVLPGKLQIDAGINRRSGDRYQNLVNDDQVGFTGFENGGTYLYFNNQVIAGNSVAIFGAESNLAPRDPSIGSRLCR